MARGSADVAGLCASCAHCQVIVSERARQFYRCGLSDTDARFARYPLLPVRQCAGYEPLAAD